MPLARGHSQMVMVKGNRVRELAGYAVGAIARFQSVYGSPDSNAFDGAQRIDKYLKTAWERVEDLHRAFRPWDQNRTGEEIRNNLMNCEDQISELERVTGASGMEDVDWRISLLQDAMGDATHKLTRRRIISRFEPIQTYSGSRGLSFPPIWEHPHHATIHISQTATSRFIHTEARIARHCRGPEPRETC